MNQISKTSKRTLFSTVLIVFGGLNGAAIAGDIDAGKSKAAVCSACHGTNGISMIPNYPNLAGQKEQYLAESLKAYRDGTRKNMIMAPMAAGLSDDDIKNLAAYYASLDPTGKN